ncbi:MAG TPA: beta-ketoacyl synthase N-terminal-like domain-containing protein [Chloroflexota bacterium]
MREVADDDGGAIVLVPSGRAWGEETFAIVHPDTGGRSEPGTVGEIWVRGDHIAVGYWQRPEETDAVFGARLADTGEGPFLRTGDLGFLRNERLVVTGRIKDLIIVRGINHYPQDIELTVERIHPLLRPGCGAAFSVDGAEEERLVVAHEVSRSFKAGDADILCGAIRRAIGEEHSLAVSAICLLPSGGIPKTSSGKVRRRFVRELYRQGTIKTVHVWEAPEAVEIESDSSDAPSVEPAHRRDKTAIVDWICRELAWRLHLRPDEIDTLAPFASYGLDSLQSVAIAARLGDWIGIELPVTLVWHYPTIDSLADYLAGTTEARRLPVERGAIQTREPIAVIGVACRFPGADGPEKFWDALLEGKDAITEVPPERWDANALYDPALSTEESANTHWGGFINGIEMFDPGFFGMSRDEARGTDPQHRLLLETAWQALEHAGIAPDSVKGSDTGVFVGISTSDYYKQMTGAPARGATGIATSMAANRVSYVFDLRGPSLAIDTACSSSLVAVDLACSALRSGTSGLALAGGVNVLLSPDLTVALSQAGLMAPDGRCKTFDEEANGYVRSEGCGLVLLKRLSDAIRDGDTVLACIRGSAVNTNGRGNGITAPSQAAQELVLRKAWDAAGLDPRSAGYLEAHGSGTVLGDLIEVQSLDSVFGESDAGDAPRAVGSVKTNIGHLEAAAGVAGLIKTVLSLHHACIPPHLHVRTLSSHLERYAQRWVIPREPLPWIGNDTPRRAGVSSFGFGGVNAHVVLEEAPPQSPHQSPVERSSFLLLLSARDRNALRTLAATYRDHLLRHDDEGLADVCATAAVGRTHFAHRYAIVAASRDEIIDSLARIHFGDLPATAVTGLVNRGKRTTLEFKFPNGEVDPSVCEVLCESEPVFRASWESWRNIPAFEPSKAGMASLAFQASLYTLWRSWGVDADRHSGTGGSLVAAVGSGLLDKNTALAGLVSYHPPQPALLTTEIECNAVLLFGQTPSTGVSGEKTVVMFPDPKHPTKGLLSAVAVLYTRGVSIDWVAFNQPLTRRRVSLPTYPFQRERCWLEQSKAGGV